AASPQARRHRHRHRRPAGPRLRPRARTPSPAAAGHDLAQPQDAPSGAPPWRSLLVPLHAPQRRPARRDHQAHRRRSPAPRRRPHVSVRPGPAGPRPRRRRPLQGQGRHHDGLRRIERALAHPTRTRDDRYQHSATTGRAGPGTSHDVRSLTTPQAIDGVRTSDGRRRPRSRRTFALRPPLAAALAAERGKLTPDDAHALLERISFHTELDALADAEIVIEAVTEDITVKGPLFRDLDQHLPDAAILASNTSSIPIAQLASWTTRP